MEQQDSLDRVVGEESNEHFANDHGAGWIGDFIGVALPFGLLGCVDRFPGTHVSKIGTEPREFF